MSGTSRLFLSRAPGGARGAPALLVTGAGWVFVRSGQLARQQLNAGALNLAWWWGISLFWRLYNHEPTWAKLKGVPAPLLFPFRVFPFRLPLSPPLPPYPLFPISPLPFLPPSSPPPPSPPSLAPIGRVSNTHIHRRYYSFDHAPLSLTRILTRCVAWGRRSFGVLHGKTYSIICLFP